MAELGLRCRAPGAFRQLGKNELLKDTTRIVSRGQPLPASFQRALLCSLDHLACDSDHDSTVDLQLPGDRRLGPPAMQQFTD